MTDKPRKRGGHDQVGAWFEGSFQWPDSGAGSSLTEERARRKNRVEQWLTPHRTPFIEILQSIAGAVSAIGEAEVRRTNEFLEPPSSTRTASNTIDLAEQAIDRLTLWREEHEELEQARSQRQPARVDA